MKYLGALGLFLLLALPASAQPSADALIGRMIANIGGIKTYTAVVHTKADLHAFISISPSLDGTFYHKEPDQNKVVFTSGVPLLGKQFSKLYPHIDSPVIWKARYIITVQSDTSGVTTFKLVPRKQGRIDHIDAKVDDHTATLTSQRWNYSDGGYASVDLTYSTIQGHPMVTGQTGKVEFPKYSAEFTSTFSDFKINAAIPDSIFADN